jgi:putative transposase
MIQADNFYHVFNQGNRKGQIFFSDDDYIYFLNLVRKYITPHCNLLAYCLMPNHFHFLINTDENSIEMKKLGNINTTNLANGFRMLQSSYAQHINKSKKEFGSLFKQKTNFKLITNTKENNYLEKCFIYIHQNPHKALLVNNFEDWKFSSYLDIAGKRNGTLIDKNLIKKYLDIDVENFNVILKSTISESDEKFFY